ncbi:Hypothetical protein BN2458_PEG1090 [Helicobacter typhlonius]|uniref:Uncharacterized protein n=1 Tax=Helicobacter typhlonius TaxID=76936 RepID=A0A0S4PWA6_9HELI|nr:Hypothetical protein BN2458_PEG1090 [Helicobacter typhlonius]
MDTFIKAKFTLTNCLDLKVLFLGFNIFASSTNLGYSYC